MALNLIRENRSRLLIRPLASFLACVALCSGINAERVDVRIRVCAQNASGTPLNDVSVTISTNERDFSIARKQDPNCVSETIKFDKEKTYTLKISASGYEEEVKALTAGDVKNNRIDISPKLNPKQPGMGSTSSGSNVGQNQPTGGGNTQGQQNTNTDGAGSRGFFSPVIDIFEFLLSHWLIALVVLIIIVGIIMSRTGYRPVLPAWLGDFFSSDKVILVSLPPKSPLAMNISRMEMEQLEIKRLLVEIRDTLKTAFPLTGKPPVVPAPPPAAAVSTNVVPAWQREKTGQVASDVRPLHERAKSLYRSLVRGGVVFPEPTYLITEPKPTSMDSFKDSDVYLEEVLNSQGTFVLFSDPNGQGYVFPNPGLYFMENALRSVFPGLERDFFERSKEEVDPVRVSQVGDGRWRVDTS